jgi:hypothetical protein
MALRAKIRGQLRIVSKAMARRLRARGVAVADDSAAVEPPAPPAAPPAFDLTDDELEKLTAPDGED